MRLSIVLSCSVALGIVLAVLLVPGPILDYLVRAPFPCVWAPGFVLLLLLVFPLIILLVRWLRRVPLHPGTEEIRGRFHQVAHDPRFHEIAELQGEALRTFLAIVDQTAEYRSSPLFPGGGYVDLSEAGRHLYEENPDSPEVNPHVVLALYPGVPGTLIAAHELEHLVRHCLNITPLPDERYGEGRVWREEVNAWWVAARYAPGSATCALLLFVAVLSLFVLGPVTLLVLLR
jgi:hypothetical protein